MLTDQENKVLALIDDSREELVAYLQQMIRFKTVTPDDGVRVEASDYRDHQEFVRATLDDMQFTTNTWEVDTATLESFPGGGVKRGRDLTNMPVVMGRRAGSGGGRSLLLNGHYDVVPAGLRESWTHDPFSGEIVDNRIYGRGANDMKGGIAAMLQAAKCILKAGVALKGDLTVTIVPDEEASCMGTLSCCQKGIHADAAIIPEPTDMQVLVAVRGSVYGRITVEGRAGHAELSQPHWSQGGAVNAIDKACKILAALSALNEEWRTHPDKQHKYLAPDTIIPTVIHGGQWYVTYPEKVEIDFGCIFLPGTTDQVEVIRDRLMAVAATDPWLQAHPPRLTTGAWLYGAEVDEDEPIVQAGLAALKDLNIPPKLRGFGSLTDCVHLINYSKIPTISIGPDIQTAHMADEYVDIGQLVDTAKTMALAIMRWTI